MVFIVNLFFFFLLFLQSLLLISIFVYPFIKISAVLKDWNLGFFCLCMVLICMIIFIRFFLTLILDVLSNRKLNVFSVNQVSVLILLSSLLSFFMVLFNSSSWIYNSDVNYQCNCFSLCFFLLKLLWILGVLIC